MAAASRRAAHPAHGGQLEDEPRPPPGHRTWCRSSTGPCATPSTTTPRSRSRSCRRSPTCARCRRSSTATGSQLRYGAQDLSRARRRAPTPARSPARSSPSSAARYVVVGHSERREHHDETDEVVNAKVRAAYAHGLTPILCVRRGAGGARGGRPRRARARPAARRPRRVTAAQARTIVIAYEPVWAIGTGEVATPEDAQEVCAAIRALLAELSAATSPTPSGCSTADRSRPPTSPAIMAQADVDGALVGGAAIDPTEFASICRYRDHVGL